MALGALIIKEKLGISDRETVEQIKENPYLQYFIGLESYKNQAPFDASMLVHFRERIGANLINQINSNMVKTQGKQKEDEEEKKTQNQKKSRKLEEIKESKNQGKLIIDATCAPADISYPTDLNLLNQARIKTEKIIDILYKLIKKKFDKKPITYRQTARKEYLKVAKKRRPTRK